MLHRLIPAAGVALLVAAGGAGSAGAAQQDWMPTDSLRVCADGNLLPFSNKQEDGFENRIAEMIGEELGLPVTYYWWPQVIGFVRNTLRERHCDLIIGAAVGEELMQNTNPYYRSAYALVYRKDSGLRATDLSALGLRGARIGVVSQTPPASVLPRYGLTNIHPYQLNIDTRAHQPARQAIEDVAARRTDAAIVWGPVAGWYGDRQDVPLEVVPLADVGSVKLQFLMSMGLRRGETRWKHWLNDFIASHQAELDAVLAEYGVPLMGKDGRPKVIETATASGDADAAEEPGEPLGYRMEAFRASTPATLEGATVVGLNGLTDLMKQRSPVLIDVLPAPPRPAGREGDAAWLPKPHDTVPGAVWLPNVGFGSLSEEMEDYYRRNLARLTNDDKAAPLVIFCERHCWMSWNAAKRAVEWGYTGVHWFPGGTTDWGEAGLPLMAVTPVEDVLN